MTDESKMACSHIFVVGNSRSGTTLMGRLLGKHSSVFTFDELHFFEELWSPEADSGEISKQKAIELAARLLNIQRNGYLTQKNSQDFITEAQEILKDFPETMPAPKVYDAFMKNEAQRHNKTIPCEQTPQNVFYIGEILKQFPEAKIINMVRDPRDVLLSQKRRWRRALIAKNVSKFNGFRYWMNYHPITISKLWNGAISAADKYEQDSRVKMVNFEKLLSDSETTVKEICDFLELSFQNTMLDVPQVGSSSEQDQPERKGINKERSESWKKGGLNTTELYLCQNITKDCMEKHGYKPETITTNPLSVGSSYATFPLKISLALLLSLKRMRRITATIKRRLT